MVKHVNNSLEEFLQAVNASVLDKITAQFLEVFVTTVASEMGRKVMGG